MLWSDGQGTLFAPVAARRQKVFKRGIDTYAKHVCRRRRDRGRRLRRPAKKHEETFLLSYFSVTKSTKSHIRERSPLLYISSRVHELVARSSAWQVRATRGRAKVGSLATLYNFSYTTRANISHERAEQIRARIVCTPAYKGAAGVNLARALTGWKAHFCFVCWLCLGFVRRAVACCRRIET